MMMYGKKRKEEDDNKNYMISIMSITTPIKTIIIGLT